MHREYRPEDLHHIERGAVVSPGGGGIDDHDRALFAFTLLLGLLIGGDLLLGLVGRGPLPAGMSLSLVAAILGASTTAVKVRVHDARRQFERRLKHHPELWAALTARGVER